MFTCATRASGFAMFNANNVANPDSTIVAASGFGQPRHTLRTRASVTRQSQAIRALATKRSVVSPK